MSGNLSNASGECQNHTKHVDIFSWLEDYAVPSKFSLFKQDLLNVESDIFLSGEDPDFGPTCTSDMSDEETTTITNSNNMEIAEEEMEGQIDQGSVYSMDESNPSEYSFYFNEPKAVPVEHDCLLKVDVSELPSLQQVI